MSLTKRQLESIEIECEFCGQKYYESIGHTCPDELDYWEKDDGQDIKGEGIKGWKWRQNEKH